MLSLPLSLSPFLSFSLSYVSKKVVSISQKDSPQKNLTWHRDLRLPVHRTARSTTL